MDYPIALSDNTKRKTNKFIYKKRNHKKRNTTNRINYIFRKHKLKQNG